MLLATSRISDFCHLHVISLLTSKFHSDWGRVIGKIKQNELDCRDTAPLTVTDYIRSKSRSMDRKKSAKRYLRPISYPVINLFAVNNRAHRCSYHHDVVYIVTFSPLQKIFLLKKEKTKDVSPQPITNRMFKIKGCLHEKTRTGASFIPG